MRRQSLRALLNKEEVVFAPGAWDALSALLIEQAGFRALCGSGFAISAGLGMPDAELYTMTENAETIRRMAAVTTIPIIADIDTGYGNAVNVMRTVRAFEGAGASAVFMEDQLAPKRCPICVGDPLPIIGIEEAVGKIQAIPGAYNVVPGRVLLGLDVRDLDQEKIDALFSKMRDEAEQIGQASGTKFSFHQVVADKPALLELRFHPERSQSVRHGNAFVMQGRKAVLRLEPLSVENLAVSAEDMAIEGRHGEEENGQDDPDELCRLQERQRGLRGPEEYRRVREPQPDQVQPLRIGRNQAEKTEEGGEPGKQAPARRRPHFLGSASGPRAAEAEAEEGRHQGEVLEVGEDPNLRGEPSDDHQLRKQGQEADQGQLPAQPQASFRRRPGHEPPSVGLVGRRRRAFYPGRVLWARTSADIRWQARPVTKRPRRRGSPGPLTALRRL